VSRARVEVPVTPTEAAAIRDLLSLSNDSLGVELLGGTGGHRMSFPAAHRDAVVAWLRGRLAELIGQWAVGGDSQALRAVGRLLTKVERTAG
jgi:hypothetical protein